MLEIVFTRPLFNKDVIISVYECILEYVILSNIDYCLSIRHGRLCLDSISLSVNDIE